jgi:hypothetical protein
MQIWEVDNGKIKVIPFVKKLSLLLTSNFNKCIVIYYCKKVVFCDQNVHINKWTRNHIIKFLNEEAFPRNSSAKHINHTLTICMGCYWWWRLFWIERLEPRATLKERFRRESISLSVVEVVDLTETMHRLTQGERLRILGMLQVGKR